MKRSLDGVVVGIGRTELTPADVDGFTFQAEFVALPGGSVTVPVFRPIDS